MACDYKLRLYATVHAARWGRLRSQLPSGTEDATNWSIVLRSRRIEGRGRQRRQGSFGTAWFGLAVDVNATNKHAQRWGTAGRAPGGYPHGRGCKPMRLGTASQRAALDKGDTVQCDAEGMAEQAIVLCASSQEESMEQYRAWPLAACSAGPGATLAKAGQGMVRQSSIDGPDAAR